jgi:hypothetical protein
MALLPAKALDLRDGHALDPQTRDGFLNILQFEGLYDSLNFLHEYSVCAGAHTNNRGIAVNRNMEKKELCLNEFTTSTVRVSVSSKRV